MTSLILFILKENKRRILSWVCFICMLFNTLPVASFASEAGDVVPDPVEVVQEAPADPPAESPVAAPATNEEEGNVTAADEQDVPVEETAAEDEPVQDNSADIQPEMDTVEPDENNIVPEGQDVASSSEEANLPSLFIDFPATGVFSGDILSVSYKYTSAKNEELVISLDNIAAEIEVKYLSDEMPVETVRTEDEETGYAYYRLSALKDEVYLIRVFVEKADEEIPYSITITEYVEPSTDAETEVQNIEPDNTGDALIDIPLEVTDDGTDETGDTTDTEPESNVVDIFPDLPSNEDTSAFDNFLNDNTKPETEPVVEEPAAEEPDADDSQQDPAEENKLSSSDETVEPEEQADGSTEELPVEDPVVATETGNDEDNADKEQQNAEIPASEAGLPDILPDTETGGNEAFDGFLVDDENNKEEPAEDSTTEEAPTDEVNIDEAADENAAEDILDEKENPVDFLVTDDEEDGEEDPAPADETVDELADEEAEETAPEENEQPEEMAEGEEESSEDATGEQDETPTDKEESESSDEDEATSDESKSEDGEEPSEGEDAEETEEEETIDLDEETLTVIDGVYTYTGHGMTVAVETTEENGLPEGAEFVLAPVSADEERVQDYIAQAAELNGVDASAIIPYVYDMHFELEGEEVHIAEGSSVKVNIVFDNALELCDVVAAPFYHAEDGVLVELIHDVTAKEEVLPLRGAKMLKSASPMKAEETDAEEAEEEKKEENKTVESIEFTTGSFSDYMLMGVGGTRSVDKYAILYSNGDLVIQDGNTPDTDKGDVIETWLCEDGVAHSPWQAEAYKNIVLNIYINTTIKPYTSDFFSSLTNVVNIYNIDNIDVSDLTSMGSFFNGCINLEHIYGMETWNTSNITNFASAFYNCMNLVTPIDLSGHNISNIASAFYNCKLLPSVDLSNCTFAVNAIANYAFYDCHNLTSINFTGSTATANNSTKNGVFYNTKSLISLDLTNTLFDYANKTSMFLEGSGVQEITLGPGYVFGDSLLPVGLWERESTGEQYGHIALKNAWNSTMADTYIKIDSYDHDNKYAILYDNGDLVFQVSNVPEESRGTVTKDWLCTNGITTPDSQWKSSTYKNNIKNVYINDTIQFVKNEGNSTTNALFYGCKNLEYIYSINNIDLSNQIGGYLSYAFSGCQKLKMIYGFNDWDLSNIKTFSSTFYNCNQLETPINLSNLTIRSFANTFKNCYKLPSVSLSGCNVHGTSVTFGSAFESCKALETIDLTNFTSDTYAYNLDNAFQDTSSLRSLDLTSNLFAGTAKSNMLLGSGITEVKLGEDFVFSNAILPPGVWERQSTGETYSAAELKNAWNSSMADTYVKVSELDTDSAYAIVYSNGDLVYQMTNEPDASRGNVVDSIVCYDNKINTSSALSAYVNSIKAAYINTPIEFTNSNIFYNYANLEYVYNAQNMVISGDSLYECFRGCTRLYHIYGLADMNIHNVHDVRYLFYNCNNLDNINDIEGWNLQISSNSQGLSHTFYKCENLYTLDLSGWDLSQAYSLQRAFYEAKSLLHVNLGNIFSDVQSPTEEINLTESFSSCYALESINDIFSNIKPEQKIILSNTFNYCRVLTTRINLSNHTIKSFSSTFYGCYALKYIDMSNCTIETAASSTSFCRDCYNLRVLDLSNITTTVKGSTLSYTFNNTYRLAYLDLSSGYFDEGSKGANFFAGSGISKVKLGSGFKFYNSILPSGNWRRESTGDIYTAEQLKAAWNSRAPMADTYEKVNVVTFDGQGGNVTPTRIVKQLDELMTEDDFPVAQRDGYTFIGWFSDETEGTELAVGDPITQSIYFARWTKNTYTLVLHRNVEEDMTDETIRIPLMYDEIYQLSPTIFENTGRVIRKWTTSEDGTGNSYNPDERVVMLTTAPNAEVHLYANWGRSQDVVVSFDSQGGSPVNDIILQKGDELRPADYAVAATYKNGYQFIGWFTDPVSGTRWDNTTKIVTEPTQLYAHWKSNIIVTFVANGGWVSEYTLSVPYGGKLTSLPYGSDRIKKFAGFYTLPNFGEGEQLTTDTIFKADATYYAHWGYQPYFNLSGGSLTEQFNVNTVYPIAENSIITITEFPDVKYDGHTLARWKLADGTTVNIGDQVDVALFPEIIAEWVRSDTVKVTFDPNGGTLSEYNYTDANNYLSMVYELPVNTALGYYPDAYKAVSSRRLDFIGWYDANDNLYTRDSIITEDITLYAKYLDDSMVTYKFIVPGTAYQATSAYNNSTTTTNGNRVTTVYRTKGDKFGILPGLSVYASGAKLEGKCLEGWYSDPEPFNTDGTLKDGVEKLLPTTVKTTNTEWYANIIDTTSEKYDDTLAYVYYTEWVNASNSEVSNVNNNLNFHPQNTSDQTASLHAHFGLNSQVTETLPIGSVRITIPKNIWKDWEGNDVGTTNISVQLPQFPQKRDGDFFSYAEDGNGNYIVLNNVPIHGGAGADFTISYTVNPLLVAGGAIDQNKDYVDGDYPYYSTIVPVLFEIDKDAENTYTQETVNGQSVTYLTNTYEADIQESTDLSLEMHTFVDPCITKSFEDIYYEWPLGTAAPQDADDYFYIKWSAYYNIKNNQPFTYMITEDTVHDGDLIWQSRNDIEYPYEVTSGNGQNSLVYFITRHDKSLLRNIPATGVKIENQVRLRTIWKSGYEQELVAPAEYVIYHWEYTTGEFDKSNVYGTGVSSSGAGMFSSRDFRQGSGVTYITDGQNQIMNDKDVWLEWELHYYGTSADTPILWDEETQTYSRQQRIISMSDGINGDIMYSSGKPAAKYVWEPSTGNIPLTDNDYTIDSLRILLEEYDGSYVNGEWGGPTCRTDYGLWKDINIYVRYRNSSDLVYYKSVRPWQTHRSSISDAYTSTEKYGYTDVDLPSDVVGWEIRYPTKYFKTVLQVNESVALHPTADVKKYVLDDMDGGYYSEIKNRGYCNIWTSDDPFANPDSWNVRFALHNFTDDTEPEHDIFFHVTDWTGGYNGANKEIYELRNRKGSLYARKYAASREKVVFDAAEGYQDDVMDIHGYSYLTGSLAMPIKTGRFYDLLPRGAAVDLSTLFGIATLNRTSASTPYANAYNDYLNSAYRIDRDCYSVRFEENWEDSGRTMMIIDFDISGMTPKDSIHFLYKLRMTYEDIASYGTTVENDVAFVDTTFGNTYASMSPGITTLRNNASLYSLIDALNENVAYNYATTNYIPVDAYSWGFYKSVKTQSDYKQEASTIPNNLYTYKIIYSQSDIASVNSMVFFDVLERGAYDDAFHDGPLNAVSEWSGTLESIDITPLTELLNGDSATVYCDPVIYYSTKAKDQFTGTDWNTANTATWTTVMPPKADITAIAVDCTRATDGSPFTLKGHHNALFYVTMKASSDVNDIGKAAVNQAMFRGMVNDVPDEETSDTSVTLTDDTPEIHKTSDPESGTEDMPCLVSIGDDLSYNVKVTNTNTEFTIPKIVVEDEIPSAFLPDYDNISVTFNQTILVSNSPRLNMVKRGSKLIFTIESLDPSEECIITVPGKVGGIAGEVFENTAVITSVNDREKEVTSETTYHKTQISLKFYKVTDNGERLGGAVIRIINIDDELNENIIYEWDTSVGSTGYARYTLEPGNYIISETVTPDGYAAIQNTAFELFQDGTIEYESGETDDKVVLVDREITTIRGVKTWLFDHEEDRPNAITIKLLRKAQEDAAPVYTGISQTVTAQDNWEYEFNDLYKYDENANEYVYSIEEETVIGYIPTYTRKHVTNGLEIKFSPLSQTANSADTITLYYDFDGKKFGKTFYGLPETANSPSGAVVQIPSDNFWIAFSSNNKDTEYGLRIDQITPIEIASTLPTLERIILPSWINNATQEEYSGGRYPETDHQYNNYENLLMHYSREMDGDILDVINVPTSTGFDIPINKLNEESEKIGGVSLTLTSIPTDGGAEIQPETWVTETGTSHIVHLYPGRYLLHENTPAEGYLVAEDIEFEVNGLGKVVIDTTEMDSVDMVDMYIEQPYPFTKLWFDTGYEANRPQSVTFNLIRKSDAEIIDTITLTSLNATDNYTWEGVFDPVPMVDENYNPIDYYVTEVAAGNDYLTYNGSYAEVNGFLVTFTEDSWMTPGCKLYITLFDSEKDGHISGNHMLGNLRLNPQYGLTYLEETDMAGKTFYVPNIGHYNRIGFNCYVTARSTCNVQIASIVPTSEIRDYFIDPDTQQTGSYNWNFSSQYYSFNNVYPQIYYNNSDSSYNWNQYAIWEFNLEKANNLYSKNLVVNTINKQSVRFAKYWSDSGHETSRPTTITLELYEETDPDTIIETKTFNVEENNYVFDNLPIRKSDGTQAHYNVKEYDVPNYKSFYSSNPVGGFMIKLSEDSYVAPGTTIRISSLLNEEQTRGYTYMEQDSIYYYSTDLTNIAGKTVYVPVCNPEYMGFLISIDGYGDAYVKVDSVIPVTHNGHGIMNSYTTYYLYKGNVFVDDQMPVISEAYTGEKRGALYRWTGKSNIVINAYDKTDLVVNKIWSDYGYAANRPSSVTFDIYNILDGESIVKTVTLNGTDHQVSEDEWSCTVTDLPKYNEDGTLAVYKVIERPIEGYTAVSKKPTGMLVTFSESSNAGGEKGSYGAVYLRTVRNGRIADQIAVHESSTSTNFGKDFVRHYVAGKTFFIPIYDDYEFVIQFSNPSETSLKIEKIELTTRDITAYLSGPLNTPLQNINPNNIVTVHGTSNIVIPTENNTTYARVIYDGAEFSEIEGQCSVINETDYIDLPVKKIWSDVGYESERPESVTYEIYNVLDEDTTVKTVTLTSADATSAYEWNKNAKDLPKYNDDNSIAEYAVREVYVEGYKSTAAKPTGMYITFSRDTLPAFYSGVNAIDGNQLARSKYSIQVGSFDKRFGIIRYFYTYPNINDSDYYGKLTKENLEALNYRVYIPIENGSDYDFIVRLIEGNNNTVNDGSHPTCTIKIEKVELTSDVVPYNVAGYLSTGEYEAPHYASSAPFQYNAYATDKIYVGHGSYDMTGKSVIHYIYDGAEPIRASVSGVVINEIDKTPLTINKIWSDTGHEENRPSSITINIYNVNDNDHIVKSVELTAEDSIGEYNWNKTVTDLPKYNADGTMAIYRYEEAPIDKYMAVPTKPTGMLITFAEDSFKYINDYNSYFALYSVYGDYTYENINYNNLGYTIYRSVFNTLPSKTFYVPIARDGQYEFAIRINNGASRMSNLKIEKVELTSIEQPYTSYTSGYYSLPDPTDSIRYYCGHGSFAIRTPYQGGNIIRYKYDAVDGTFTNMSDANIVNEYGVVELPITKNWLDEGYEDKRPAQIEVDIYNSRDLETIVKTVTLTAANASGDYTWEAVAEDLPKYNTDMSLANYVIKERETQDYLASYTNPKGLLVTISSDSFINYPIDSYNGVLRLYSVSNSGSRYYEGMRYIIGDLDTGGIFRAQLDNRRTYYVPIVEDGFYAFGFSVNRFTYNEDPNLETYFKIEKVELTTIEQQYAADTLGSNYTKFSDLQESHIIRGNGSPVVVSSHGSYDPYFLYIYDGPTASINESVSHGYDSVITNEYNKIDCSFEKHWNDTGFEEYRPASVTFQVYNERSPYVVIKEKTVTRAEAESGNVWTYTFEELPKYNPDGSLAVYMTKEKEVSIGYTSTKANKDIKGFLLKFSNDSDLTNGATLTIYQSDGEKAINYVSPTALMSPPYWMVSESNGVYVPIAGKTVFVPVYTPGVYEFMIQLTRLAPNSTSSLIKANYTIDSITPVYDELPSNILTGPTGPSKDTPDRIFTESGYTFGYKYETVENVTSISRNVGGNNAYTHYNTFFKYNIDSGYNGLSNTLEKFPVAFNKYSFDHEYLAGAHLQVLKSDKSTVIDQWDTTGDSNHVVMLPYGKYYLRETSAPEGYEIAEDLEFNVSTAGVITVPSFTDENEFDEVSVVRMLDNEKYNITFDKYWDDSGFSQYRSQTAVFDIYDADDMDTVVQTVSLTAADQVDSDTTHWQGKFESLPRCHEDGTEIQYIIRERNVANYNTEYAGEHLVVNSSDSFRYTPKYSLKINWAKDAWTNGPLYMIWKDKMSGDWAYSTYGVSPNSNPTILNAQEAYLMYKSYGYRPGIVIDNVEPAIGAIGNELFQGCTYLDAQNADEAIASKMAYITSSTITTADFVDGSNGYRDNAASADYSAGTVIQLVKVSIPTTYSTRVTKGITGQEILDAEGFRVKFGGDSFANYGPRYVVWKDTNTGKYKRGFAAFDANTTIDIPSKEFYLYFRDAGSGIRNAGITIQSIRPLHDSDAWLTSTDVDGYDTVEECLGTISEGMEIVDGRYGISATDYATTSSNRLYSFIYSAQYQSFTSDTPVIDDYTITNRFDYHQWPVPITKSSIDGALISGAHLKVYDTSNELISEWDSSTGGPQVVNLWPGTYTLKETTVPTGYLQASDITFTVTPIGEIIVNSTEVSTVNMIDDTSLTLAIDKVDYAQQTNHLSGAVLKLYEGNNELLTWTSNGTPKDITSYVKYGHDYRIHESTSPRGYNLMSEDIFLHIGNDGTVTITTSEWAVVTGDITNGYVVTLYNQAGVFFPSTGASDRTWVYIGAVMIMMATAAFLVRRKRRRNNA